jgi:hypothetical protein
LTAAALSPPLPLVETSTKKNQIVKRRVVTIPRDRRDAPDNQKPANRPQLRHLG